MILPDLINNGSDSLIGSVHVAMSATGHTTKWFHNINTSNLILLQHSYIITIPSSFLLKPVSVLESIPVQTSFYSTSMSLSF